MPQLYSIDLVPLPLWSPILTPRGRLAAIAGLQVMGRWLIEAVSAVLACVAVAGIAIGFASIGEGDNAFFDLATRSIQTIAELLR